MSWPRTKIKEVADLITKGTTPTTLGYSFVESGVPFLRAQNLIDGTVSVDADPLFISHETHAALKRSKIQAGDLLVSIAGTIGRASLVPDKSPEMNCNQAVAIIRLGDRLDRRFVLHWLSSDEAIGQIAKSKVTGVISNLSLGEIGALEIPFPPLDEQKRIAGILDQADALRRLRAHALDKLNTLGQAIFHEMFGEALRGDFFEFGQAVEEFRYGTSNKSGDAGLPTLRIPNVIGGGIDITEIKTVEVTGPELERLRLSDGDVLFVRTNGNPDYVGRCAAFSFAAVANYDADTDWIFASYLIRARLSDRINPSFAKTYFASQVGRSAVRERCKTSAGQYNINTEGLASLPFPDVPRAAQDRFAEALAAIEQSSAPMKRSAVKMGEKFAALQYSAFQGGL